MADLSYLKKLGKPIAVLGLGVTGSAVAHACRDANIPVHLWDEAQDKQDAFLRDGFNLFNFQSDLSSYAMLVPSAGIKPSHPALEKATTQNIPIRSDIDLLFNSAPDATYIGITGTNGKSTTTVLMTHILKTLNKNFAMGGNIGVGAAGLPALGADGIYVLELSSYQLEITHDARFDIAVCLNITPDHLAWHDTMEHYTNAKGKVFRVNDGKKQTAIIGTDTPITAAMADKLENNPARDIVKISLNDTLPDAVTTIETLKGAHNQQNIAAAFAVCKALGVSEDDFIRSCQTFPGLVHRQQVVDTINDITFINDSKATNAEAAAKALSCFDNIHWIVGGQDKDDGLDGLEFFYPKIKKAYLIGVSSHRFAGILDDHLPYSKCDTLDHAVSQAFQNARPNDVVLLSPACTSFDQYPNFEKRGDHFIALVKNLKQRQIS